MDDSNGVEATYGVTASASDVAAIARDICIEQTAEVSEPLCRDPVVSEQVLGRLVSISEARPGRYLVRIRYAGDVLTDELPHDMRQSFTKLHKKDHLVIVPVSNGVCAGCGMRLPISLVQAVRMEREVHSCPNC